MYRRTCPGNVAPITQPAHISRFTSLYMKLPAIEIEISVQMIARMAWLHLTPDIIPPPARTATARPSLRCHLMLLCNSTVADYKVVRVQGAAVHTLRGPAAPVAAARRRSCRTPPASGPPSSPPPTEATSPQPPERHRCRPRCGASARTADTPLTHATTAPLARLPGKCGG